jgi:hypothetical protein
LVSPGQVRSVERWNDAPLTSPLAARMAGGFVPGSVDSDHCVRAHGEPEAGSRNIEQCQSGSS